jgi:hypothetical protein
MRLYDPTSSTPRRRFVRAPALPNLEGKTIGILENGKLNAEAMLREIALLFEDRHACTVAEIYSKSNPSAPAPAATLKTVAQEVDFVITGLGD